LTPTDSKNKIIEQLSAICMKGFEENSEIIRNSFGRAYGEILYSISKEEVEKSNEKKNNGGGIFSNKVKEYNIINSLSNMIGIFSKQGISSEYREGVTYSIIHFLKQFKEEIIINNLSNIIESIISLLMLQKTYTRTKDFMKAQFLVSKIFRNGLTLNFTENGKIKLLNEILKIIQKGKKIY
jgi:hypothetical protein